MSNPTNREILIEIRAVRVELNDFKRDFYNAQGFMRGLKWTVGVGLALLALIKGKGSFADVMASWNGL